MALLHRITNQGVLWLQVEDVVLVDARRHQQEGAFVDLRRERGVLQQLKVLVLKDHAAFGGGHVAAYLEGAVIRLAQLAALQVAVQQLHAFGQARAAGVHGQLLRLGVEGQKVARRSGIGHLLHRKLDAGLDLGLGLHGVSQRVQSAGVEQIQLRQKVCARRRVPNRRGKAAVFARLHGVLERLIPELRRLFQVALLHCSPSLHRQLNACELLKGLHRAFDIRGFELRQGRLARLAGRTRVLSWHFARPRRLGAAL